MFHTFEKKGDSGSTARHPKNTLCPSQGRSGSCPEGGTRTVQRKRGSREESLDEDSKTTGGMIVLEWNILNFKDRL